MKRGVIVKIYETYQIVLSEGQYYKLYKRQEMAIGQELLFTEEDMFVGDTREGLGIRGYYKVAAMVASIALIVVLGILFSSNGKQVMPEVETTIFMLDINPSFKFEVDEYQVVVTYEAVNEDALSLNIEGVIGLSIEEAVEKVTLAASEAGFLDVDDLQDDFILMMKLNWRLI